jgi:alpha-L-fucosidase 2
MKILPWLALAFVTAAAAAAAELKTDIEYGRAGDVSLRLNAGVPDGAGPFPVAILVHGGGWSHGDKAGSDVPGNSADISPWFGILNQARFTWFSINYRMAPAYRWPACLEDLQTAIRWAKAHAAEYKGDPRRIVLFGHSAGGHLVCLAGLVAGEDTRVQGVVGCAPVADLVQDSVRRGGLSTSLQALFGLPKELTDSSRAILHAASPIFHLTAASPPFLLVQGLADQTVPYPGTRIFQDRLQAAGIPCQLIGIPGAPHSMMTWEKLDPGYPARLDAWLAATVGR